MEKISVKMHLLNSCTLTAVLRLANEQGSCQGLAAQQLHGPETALKE